MYFASLQYRLYIRNTRTTFYIRAASTATGWLDPELEVDATGCVSLLSPLLVKLDKNSIASRALARSSGDRSSAIIELPLAAGDYYHVVG